MPVLVLGLSESEAVQLELPDGGMVRIVVRRNTRRIRIDAPRSVQVVRVPRVAEELEEDPPE